MKAINGHDANDEVCDRNEESSFTTVFDSSHLTRAKVFLNGLLVFWQGGDHEKIGVYHFDRVIAVWVN
jgi:hypothetical protein